MKQKKYKLKIHSQFFTFEEIINKFKKNQKLKKINMNFKKKKEN